MAESINEIEEESGSGFIQIADDVVSGIAGLAVMEVEGVSGLAGGISKDAITKLGKKNLAKGIRIDYGENGLTVDTSIEVKFGYNIVEVSRAVQEKVRSNIVTMTGLTVKKVNVKISGIDLGAKK
ncbi:MAG: Asp23/Gls24 family envelope stress response protein [Eubacterium sp.]|nr:Asp23/Gls24 family envelope stress response protein [Eubacterium sp.]